MPEKQTAKQAWEKENPNSNYENRKALYADKEYLRILKEDGYKEAKKHRTDNPLKTISGYAAGGHRKRRKKIFQEIKENHDNRESLPESETILSQWCEKRFQELVVEPYDVVQNNDALRENLHKLTRLVIGIDSREDISEAEKLSEIDGLHKISRDQILFYLHQDIGARKEDREGTDAVTEQIAKAAITVGYNDIGYTRSGGRELEDVPVITTSTEDDDSAPQPNYAKMIEGVDNIKMEATLAYYRKLTGNPNAEIPHGQEFNKLVKEWGKLKQAGYYTLIYGLPVAGAIVVGAATGGASLWIHALASTAGLAGGTAVSILTNKRGGKSGSRLRDIELLGGLKELNKRTNAEGYLAPPKYNEIHGVWHSLFNESPQRNVRHLNISYGDLKYILDRGEGNVRDWQKRARIATTVLSVLSAAYIGYMHKDSIAGLFVGDDVSPVSTPPTPTIPDTGDAIRSWWQHFSSSDGTGPKLTAPQIPNCYVPEGLHTN